MNHLPAPRPAIVFLHDDTLQQSIDHYFHALEALGYGSMAIAIAEGDRQKRWLAYRQARDRWESAWLASNEDDPAAERAVRKTYQQVKGLRHQWMDQLLAELHQIRES